MTSLRMRSAISTAIIACMIAGASPATAGLFGPGKFKVEQSDDRFSASPNTTWVGRNNRVTKRSPVGGTYIGSQGFYLNPFISRNRKDGTPVELGFMVENRTEIDTTFGSPNSLGRIERIAFLIDGSTLISAQVHASEERFGERTDYNSILESASSSLTENGVIFLSINEMIALAGARTVAIKIEGSRQSWTIEVDDVSGSFLNNIRQFFEGRI